MVKLNVYGADSAKHVAEYLPGNYKVTGTHRSSMYRLVVEVEGEDVAGWTAEDYVIPRLASGLMWAYDVDRPLEGK